MVAAPTGGHLQKSTAWKIRISDPAVLVDGGNRVVAMTP
jgi:hypothetical protein